MQIYQIIELHSSYSKNKSYKQYAGIEILKYGFRWIKSVLLDIRFSGIDLLVKILEVAFLSKTGQVQFLKFFRKHKKLVLYLPLDL